VKIEAGGHLKMKHQLAVFIEIKAALLYYMVKPEKSKNLKNH